MLRLIITILAALSLSACAQDRLERQAIEKCGANGTVDWDDNPDSPPPHCG